MSSEPDDLLGKADALMARQHPGRPPAARNPDIPVLEEVVDYASESDDLPLLTELVEPTPLDEEQTEMLLASIRAELLAVLKPRIDALIEARLKDDFSPLIESLFDDLRAKLQLTAHDILDDAVHGAVEHELRRRKSGG